MDQAAVITKPSRPTKMSFHLDVPKLIITLLMLLFGLLMMMPFAWMISASLKKPIEVFQYPIQWIPHELQFSNYSKVWFNKTYPFYLFYWNSIKVAILTIGGTVLISATAAYAFARMDFRGKNIVFMLYLSTLMIPPHVTLVPRFILFHWIGVYNTHWALILPGMFNVIGIFMLRQFFISIPKEISEAAHIDGAHHFKIFYKIIMPLSIPGVISLVILSFVWNWNSYMDPLIFITSKSLYTIPLGLQTLNDAEGAQYNLVMAGATCAIIPIIAVFLAGQKYFIQGIASSGVKG
ncbi:carbohydrate ABC transporter permease [Paenibacillus qinlingensis]|uniref:Multiple sugar transport system permease protein n=1 Tax=Paenibacillus qinlingensis TaxID=1837343 RepID=A0ABU1NST0_9BACL|nr:carbohydrate ABC transporter permease [Paenibacillus qinlingensis]MDR6550540.1 multiple sugar transport system permease protein [Paenibacillus qinlingensis]